MRSKCNDDELFDGQMRVRACAKWIATPKATDRSRNLLLQHDNGVGARQQPFRRRCRTNPKETDQTKNLAVRRETQTDGAAVCYLDNVAARWASRPPHRQPTCRAKAIETLLMDPPNPPLAPPGDLEVAAAGGPQPDGNSDNRVCR